MGTERQRIVAALRAASSTTQAASALGISVRTLRRRMHEYGIESAPRGRPRKQADAFAARVVAAVRRVRRECPDLDEQTVICIVERLLRPLGSGQRFFLRKRDDGSFVF